jgi:hypothetical protein
MKRSNNKKYFFRKKTKKYLTFQAGLGETGGRGEAEAEY